MMVMMTRLVRAECHGRIFGISSTNQWVTLERSCNTSAFQDINDHDDGKEEDRRFIQCLCCPAVVLHVCLSPHHTIVPKWSVFVSVARFCQLCLAVNVTRCSSVVCWYLLSVPLWFWCNKLHEGCLSCGNNYPCPAKDLSVCRFIEDDIFARTILPAKWPRPKGKEKEMHLMLSNFYSQSAYLLCPEPVCCLPKL